VTLLLSEPIDWRLLVFSNLSLTVVRLTPVALAMIRSGLRPDSVAIMGWFGPRGLASVVFTLLAFGEFQDAGRPVFYADSCFYLDDPLECHAAWLDGCAAVSLVCTPPGGDSTTTDGTFGRYDAYGGW